MSEDVRVTEKRGFEERQFAVSEVELRDGETTAPVLHGYASTFNEPYVVHDKFGQFEETILPGAWTRS
jgi:phage head maturation protease